MAKQNPIRVFGLSCDDIKQLQQIALVRYGKASASLMLRKLAEEYIRQPENSAPPIIATHQEKKRFTLRLPPKHQAYIAHKAELQHSSLNDIVRDIIAEYITQNPVISNDAVQALYQSNYQLLRIGRNINQLARQFNAMLPQSITTKQLNEIAEYLDYHGKIVGKVIGKAMNDNERPFKPRESRCLENFANPLDNPTPTGQ